MDEKEHVRAKKFPTSKALVIVGVCLFLVSCVRPNSYFAPSWSLRNYSDIEIEKGLDVRVYHPDDWSTIFAISVRNHIPDKIKIWPGSFSFEFIDDRGNKFPVRKISGPYDAAIMDTIPPESTDQNYYEEEKSQEWGTHFSTPNVLPDSLTQKTTIELIVDGENVVHEYLIPIRRKTILKIVPPLPSACCV